MIPEMKLVVTKNDKTLHTLTKEIKVEQIVKSLKDFQKDVNALLTKMIQELDDEGNNEMVEDEYYSSQSSDDDEQNPTSPKKTRK